MREALFFCLEIATLGSLKKLLLSDILLLTAEIETAVNKNWP